MRNKVLLFCFIGILLLSVGGCSKGGDDDPPLYSNPGGTTPVPGPPPAPDQQIVSSALTPGSTPRAMHAASISQDGRIYIFGGNSTSGPLADLWQYDIITSQWKMLTPTGSPPAPRQQASAVFYDNKIYFFGGWNGNLSQPIYYNDVWSYSINTNSRDANEWKLVRGASNSANVPQGRGGHTAVVYGDGMYVFGGVTAQGINGELWRYDFASATWNNNLGGGTVAPSPRFGHSSVIYKNSLYVYGGELGNGQLIADSLIYRYNIDSDQWVPTAMVNFPTTGSAHHSAVVMGDTMYVYGGQIPQISQELFTYHFPTNFWMRTLSNAPASSYHSAVFYKDTMYIFGGIFPNNTFSNNLQRFPLGAKPANPFPINKAVGVSQDATLSWSITRSATGYDVHLGTALDNLTPILIDRNITYVKAPSLQSNTVYYWRVDVRSTGNVAITGDVWSFTTDGAVPAKAGWGMPLDGTPNVTLAPLLSWASANGATSYDVYFGTNPAALPPAGNQTATSFAPLSLLQNTTYYWRIDSRNGGSVNTGDIWSFTTGQLPAQAANSSPAANAIDVPLNSQLVWNAAKGATSYNVYFGQDTPGNIALVGKEIIGTYYNPGVLTTATTYYWRIDAKNSVGAVVGTTWSFTTDNVQLKATDPDPADNAFQVGVNKTLSWTGPAGATQFNVYLAKDSSQNMPLAANQAGTSYIPPQSFVNNSTYYWRIDSIVGSNVLTGDVWRFSTGVTAGKPTNPVPANGATSIPINQQLSWTAASNAVSYNVYFGTTNPPTNIVSAQAGTSYDPGTLSLSTTYFWRVDAVSITGTITTGDVWSFTTGLLPSPVTAINPPDGSKDQPLTLTFIWSTDPNALTYDLYLDTVNPPVTKVSSDQAATNFTPATPLNPSTLYYWRVVSKNPFGSATSAVFNFSTANLPVKPSNPSPPSNATNVPFNAFISWGPAAFALNYHIDFGDADPPPRVQTDYPADNPPTPYNPYAPAASLDKSKQYFWLITSKNNAKQHQRAEVPGDVWNFTTADIFKLRSGTTAAGQKFGSSIAIDGNYAVVGAPGDNDNQGAIYVFRRGTNNIWNLTNQAAAKITASDGAANHSFGHAVAISNDTIIATAPDNGTGAAYIFARNQGDADGWQEVLKLTTPVDSVNFGHSAAIYGDHAIVGDPNYNGSRGRAYIFQRNNGGADQWQEVKTITAGDAAAGDQFGFSVDIHNDQAIVGAIYGDDLDADPQIFGCGAAYVFLRNQGGVNNWGQVKKIMPVDSDLESGDQYGYSVTISGDFAAIGAPATAISDGAVYIFQRNYDADAEAPNLTADNWGQKKKITGTAGAAERLGYALAIDVDRLVVGAPFADNTWVNDSGVAYVYERNEGGTNAWGQTNKLESGDSDLSDFFGAAVAISGSAVLTGSRLDDDLGLQSGSGYVFHYQNALTDATEIPMPPTVSANSNFGTGIGVYNNFMVAGLPGHPVNNEGVIDIIRRENAAWNHVIRWQIVGVNTEEDKLGSTAAMHENILITGAPDADGGGNAYIFERNWKNNGSEPPTTQADNWGRVTSLGAGSGSKFGAAVAIDVDTAVVGAPDVDSNRGKAYVYSRNQFSAENWGQVRSLLNPDPADGDRFGSAVAVSLDTAVVGAPGRGGVYIYKRNQGGANNWGLVATINGIAADRFGAAVALSLDILVVGVPDEDSEGRTDSGAVYIYARNEGGADVWGLVKRIQASDAANAISEFANFGASVAIDVATLVVGAPRRDTNADEGGAAYIFGRNEGGLNSWGEKRVLNLPAGTSVAEDHFGTAVAISKNTVMVGVPNADTDGQENAGKVYLFVADPNRKDPYQRR